MITIRGAGTTRVVFVNMALMLMVGCAPFVSQYQYLSLEKVPGIEVTESADPEIDRVMFVEGAYFVKPIPVGYLLQRPTYVLRIRVPRRSLDPVLIFNIEPYNGSKLKLTGFVRVVKTEGGYSAIRHDVGVKDDEFEFQWIGGVVLTGADRAADGSQTIEVSSRLEISFIVLDHVGTVVAKESLPFQVKSNGYFWMWDGI